MGDKELLFRTLRHEPTERVPWVPFAGVHAGKLTGACASDVLTDGDTLLQALREVNRVYDPDGQPVVFDLQVEAEILGCELIWSCTAPPSVAVHPLAEALTVPDRLPQPTDGRLPLILDVTRRLKAEVGATTALYGVVCGPFTLASHLRGTDLFMDMYDDPETLAELIAYTTAVARQVTGYYIEAGIDVVAVTDPLVSQISSAHFREFLSGPFRALFDWIREQGVFSSFFVCGDATRNIEVMCQTGPDSISIDENIDMAAAKAITDRYNIALGGNIPLTTVMLLGSQQANMKWVVDWLDTVAPPNLILAPGCDMPYDIPPENVIGVMDAVRQPEQVRRLLADYASEDLFDAPVELPDYANLERPLVEVFTIDSDTCAACTYMFRAALRAREVLGTPIDVIEYKSTLPENVARVRAMGVQQLPSIYVNGELQFASIIPGTEALLTAIRAAMAKTSPERR